MSGDHNKYQKPACWLHKGEAHLSARDLPPDETIPLYTAPPKKEWVGLTKDEVELWKLPTSPTVYEFALFVEAKLKEKNNG